MTALVILVSVRLGAAFSPLPLRSVSLKSVRSSSEEPLHESKA